MNVFVQQKQHTRKPGTPEHRTTEYGTLAEQQNTPESGRTTKHYPEHQNETIPERNGTIQNEKQL